MHLKNRSRRKPQYPNGGIPRLQPCGGCQTVIIESSFVAIERSIQFYVEEKGYDVAGQRHTEVYDLGVRAGLFSRGVADRLEALWIENRSESYYRTGVAGEYRARTIHELAVQLHDETVQLTRTQDCLCE
ncbi:hypothetical protein [Natrialba hulunbeirensis]|uniref:hypothetical protein n=1 Tax=Natrialba hulunbeirensis TaxID=123783 RepID=UPI001F4CA100|nr:hypothetical protein [Natrialba hulunbeirensis]